MTVCRRSAAEPVARRLEPVTAGVPFPRGLLGDPACVVLRDGSGAMVPVQVRALDHWSDGSVRWALVDFRADVPADGRAGYDLGLGPEPRNTSGVGTATIVERNDGLVIDAGAVRFSIGSPPGFCLRVHATGGGQAFDIGQAAFDVRDASNQLWPLTIDVIRVEESGALRSVVLLSGRASRRPSGPALSVGIRVHLFPSLPIARFEVTIRNPRRARHPGGIWELGDSGSVHLRDVAFAFRLGWEPSTAEVRCSTRPGLPMEDCGSDVELYQDSSGRPNWRSPNHVNRHSEVPNTFQGFRLRSRGGETAGLCATPVVAVRKGLQEVSLAVPEFWQNCPKALEASAADITLRLFPRQYADTHELQGGEQKTHRFWMAFGHDPVTDEPLHWCRDPLLACAEPRWYCECEAVPFLTPSAENPHDAYLGLVNQAVEGENSFERKRDLIDEYGWRHFGDVYADHEAAYHKGPHPFISHYNNQYDAVAGLASQFLMTADPRWWVLMDELAHHVVDVDIYHTARDKAAFNGGLFWHTYHYLDAGRSAHRSYPRAEGVFGGGPSNEHNYSTGLMLHHFLTGEPASRDAVLGLAEWVVDMDDGDKTVFRWLARGDTGLAIATASVLFHGPGRGAGNSIAALLNGHRLAGDRRLLEKAEQVIRRCISPWDDIASLDLLDAERRWSYTVFLQQLGKYLAHKAGEGELDELYAYARASLLHYARWMSVHEYPYLEKPEILEYPNETWPAQDMRKCEVLQLAALHTSGPEREGLLGRARFFFDYSISTLSRMDARALTRPLVLLLSYGFARAWFERHPDAALPRGEELVDCGEPEVFVPQKVRALRRAKMLLVAGGLIGLGAGIALVLGLLLLA